ncbi:bacterial low temperature requirement A protein-domain-containing protein [Phaeosphaeriaceae sp. PMI808]|nr:bacterial low temperature requirement A protein-domain-containing protein [Phaeosphaeriaceae sp. PMI808]
MGHEGGHHHSEEKTSLSFFASPLHEPSHESLPSSDVELQQKSDPNSPHFDNTDYSVHNNPTFHRHAEATTAELFYDLFFVANLTTFTSNLEINDGKSLSAYIGFFSLLWLTWYQVSLYDVRFSADSVFERTAKAIHFGIMVGFAVIGPQWKPGQEIKDYKIFRAFGFALMVSRLTLFCQYGVTLMYTKKYKKTILPLSLVMGMTLLAAILYGALTTKFPRTIIGANGVALERKSHVYIAWYVIAISETILTVVVSCVWRIISFKGTHMVQRMSLLTLIILGEGIIVICKSISKIVKNDYLWTTAVVGQIVTAVLIIYLLYMLYFDRMHEEHFGSIRQQVWSFLHFPLHTVYVLVLQGVSLLIIWRQAIEAIHGLSNAWKPALDWAYVGTTPPEGTLLAKFTDRVSQNYTRGMAFADYINATNYQAVYSHLPKGIDTSKEIKTIQKAYVDMVEGFDFSDASDGGNQTANDQLYNSIMSITSATYKTLFDTFSVTVSKSKLKKIGDKRPPDLTVTEHQYFQIFDLIFSYTFVAGGLALILTSTLGYLALPVHHRRIGPSVRLAITGALGVALCLVALIRFNNHELTAFLGSSWMIPTICLVLFICVVIDQAGMPKKRKAH